MAAAAPVTPRSGTTSRRLLAAALALGALPVGFVAGARDEGTWGAAAVAACGAAVVLLAAPRRGAAAGPWRLLGLGMASGAVGLAGRAWEGAFDGNDPELPRASDVAILAGLAVVAAAVAVLASSWAGREDWIARLDAAVVGGAVFVAAAVLLWPDVLDAELAAPGVAVMVASAGLAALGTAAAVRLAVTGASRLMVGRLVVAGAVVLVAGELLARAAQLPPAGSAAEAARAAGAAGPMLLAAACVLPSAGHVGGSRQHRAHDLSPLRLLVLAVAVASGPISALVHEARDGTTDVPVLAVGTTLLVVLLAARLALVAVAGQRHAAREVGMRELAGELGRAGDAVTVRRIVLEGAARLAGGRAPYAAWLSVNDRGVASPVTLVGPDGPIERAATGIDPVLEAVEALDDVGLWVRDSSGADVVVVPVPCRVGQPAAFVVATEGRGADGLDESLTVVGAQAALALDALAQRSDVHDQRSDAQFQQIVRHSSDAVVIVGRDGRVRYQSPSVVRVLGHLTVDLDGAPASRLAHPDEVEHFRGFLEQLIHAPNESVRTLDVRLLRADDSALRAEVVGSNLLENPDVNGIVLTIRDVTGRRTLEDQLRHQAFHDPLTGLSNRALFVDRVEHALDRVRRTDAPTPAVAFIDLDDFKLVNDTLGHGAGDELLCAVADRLRSCLRSGDTPARLGGDEFAVLLEDAPDTAAVLEVAERILDALHEPFSIAGRSVYARGSIGIATRHGSATPDELLRHADLAMYTAKANGKGRIEIFELGMQHRARDREALSSELARSVALGDIGVAYQPIVRLGGGEIVAFEALARWSHPARGPVSPVEFIPIAESSGVIVDLGRLIVQRSCQQLAVWLAANPQRAWQMSVNLSARQLLDPDLLKVIEESAADAGIEPTSLIVELTESVLLSDSERVLRRLHLLKDAGVQVAIDDFGTGYSSLSYLQRVPFDLLKIDRAFVAALRTDEPSATLVRTMMDLGRALGRRTVAEGVEEQVELDGLLELGCQLGQGTLFAGAADAATLERDLHLLPARA